MDVIIAIIIAMVVGGGIVYYTTKTPAPAPKIEENNQPLVIKVSGQEEIKQVSTSTSVEVINSNSVGAGTGSNNIYTYSNHGFSIVLPKGFIPKEEESEGGPAIMISLPTGGLAYVTDASFWEKYNIPNYIYVKDQKIGETTFKVYTTEGSNLYWLKEGNVGYEFSVQKFGMKTDTAGLENILKTFKFIGWGD